MADQREPLGEFEREKFVFAVLRDGEVHRVEAREGGEPAALVCHIYQLLVPTDWGTRWAIDSWKPWIDQQARWIIAAAEHTDDDPAAVVADNQNP